MLLALTTLVALSAPVSLEGHWEGAVNRLGSVQTFSIDFRDNTHATMDIPDRRRHGDFMEDVTFDGETLQFRSRLGHFRAQYHAEINEFTGESLEGTWDPPVQIHFKRASMRAPRYHAIPFKVEGANRQISGELLLPVRDGRFPAIAIAHPGDVTEPHTAYYFSYAVELAERGIACAIYDKVESEDIVDQASNLQDVLKWLRGRPDVLQNKVGAMGISQGGWAVSMLAATGVYDFSILLVTPSTSVFKQELDRVLHSMRADERPEAEIHAALAHTKLMLYCATGKATWEDYSKSQVLASKEPWSEYVSVDATEQDLKWWQRNNYDPAKDLSKMKARTLAVFGEVDTLVPVATNRDLMSKLLEGANRQSEVWTAERCGHGLESFSTLLGGEWKWPKKFWVWPRKAAGLYERLENFIRS